MATETQKKALEKEFRASIAHLPAAEKRVALLRWRAEQAEKAVQPQPAQAEAEAPKPQKRVIPHGPLTWTVCDLEGFEGVEVGFDLNARWDALYGPIKDDDGLGVLRRMMTMAPQVRNMPTDPMTEQPFPGPVYGDLETYRIFVMRLLPLGLWIINRGLHKAIEESTKNSVKS